MKINIEKIYLVGWNGREARVEIVLTGGYSELRTVKALGESLGDEVFRKNLRVAVAREIIKIRREMAA